MNTSLIINTHNLADIEAFVQAAAESQKEKVNGALAITFQSRIGNDQINALIAPLASKFSALKLIPVNLNASLSNDARNSTLFAIFIAQAYAMYPGPWLIVDGPGVPRVENVFTELAKQHKLLGGPVSGRVAQDGMAMVPVGPVVIGLPLKSLTWFSPSVTESWRARARFLFNRCGFKVVPLEEYLFSLSSSTKIEAPSQLTQAPIASQVSYPDIPNPKPDGSEVASTQETPQTVILFKVGDKVRTNTIRGEGEPGEPDEVIEVGVLSDGTGVVLSRGGVFPKDELELVEATPQIGSAFHFMEKDELLTEIELRGIEKPHHATGKTKLIEILTQHSLSQSEAATDAK